MMRAGARPRRIFDAEQAALGPYVPSFQADWLRDAPGDRFRCVEGTLVFADVSGFTRLTELFAAAGRIGGEEIADVINHLLEWLLSAAYAYGAGLIKYGGDAVLLLFEGEDHVQRGCRAALDMQAAMRRGGRVQTSRGVVRMRLSVGVHSGPLDFLLVGGRHLELIVTGAGATTVTQMEKTADAGQVVISRETAQALTAAGERAPTELAGSGLLLRTGPAAKRMPAPLLATDYSMIDLGLTLSEPLRAHLSSGAIDHEHRRVTVGFVKFTGADRVLAERGEAALTAAIARIISGAQDAAAANEVTMLTSDVYADGAKLLLIAGAPRQIGHDEDRMLATIRAIVGLGGELPLHGGVNSGQAFTGNYGPAYRQTFSVLGDCVNLAARLMEHARPGELLTTAPVIGRASGSFVVTALRPFAVKGKSEPVQAFTVGDSYARHGDRVETEPMIGRAEELRVLLEADADAAAGRGRTVELVGPAGIGKSRLLAALRERTTGTLLQADGDIYSAGTPYAPFVRMLRARLGVGDTPADAVVASALRARCRERAPALEPWLPLMGIVAGLELPETPEVSQTDPGVRKERLEELTSAFLAAALDGPQTFIFNDTHLMDDASVDLIARLAQDAPGRPWLIVIARRPHDAGERDPADGTTRLELQPLRAQDAEALLAHVTAANPLPPYRLALLARRAAGNPLFLHELVAQVTAGGDPEHLPESVQDAIAARIDRLSPAHRRLVRAAAVLGVTVDVGVLGGVLQGTTEMGTGSATAALELGELDDLLEPIDATHRRFSHELVREVAYEGLPFRRRKELHASTATAIELLGGGEPESQADLLSLHCFHGGLYEAAWQYALIAARAARAHYANVEAAESYRRALQAAVHLPGLERSELIEVERALGELCIEVGEFAQADACLRRARRHASGAPLTRARLDLSLARLRESAGRYPAALRWVTRGEEDLIGHEHGDTRSLRAQLAVARARVHYRQGRHAACIASAESAIALARGTSDRRTLADALEYRDAAAASLGQPAGEGAAQALAIYEELGELHPQARLHNTLGVLAYHRGHWSTALAEYEAAQHAYERAGWSWGAAISRANRAEILIDQRRLDEAGQALREAMPVWVGSGAASATAFGRYLLGRVHGLSGQPGTAMALFDLSRAFLAGAGEAGEVVTVDAFAAECVLLAGGHEEALMLAEETLLRARSLNHVHAVIPLLERVRGLALLGLDRRGDALVALRDSLARARQRGAGHDLAFTLSAALSAGVSGEELGETSMEAELERVAAELDIQLV